MFSMNTGLVGRGNASPPSRYELDRKFKSFVELAKKLEAINVKAQTVSKLFSSKALQIRNQLLEESKHLFRYGPIEHGKLVEDFIWKRVYYDYVRFFKLKVSCTLLLVCLLLSSIFPENIQIRIVFVSFPSNLGHWTLQEFVVVVLQDFQCQVHREHCSLRASGSIEERRTRRR